ncbi:MAG: glycosyltransferase 87 family protein [Thermonemataceae bacterium]
MKAWLKKAISNRRYLIGLYIIFALVASVQSLLLGTNNVYVEGGYAYNHYNNYTIFEQSFYHLLNDQDLYILYPKEHWDLYKYTPTFSVFFGLFAIFPDWAGLTLWNLVNALILLAGIYYLPQLTNYQKGLVLVIILIELMTAMQNDQSNGLMAGLLVCAFGLLERRHYALATLCIVFSAFIKLFGVVGFALCLFYPRKGRQLLYTLLWVGVMLALPLIFVSYEQYVFLFRSYLSLLTNDHSVSYGYSVMGWLHTWFSLEINKLLIVLLGAVVFMLPFVRLKAYTQYWFRYLTAASVLIWVVIFNHKAESPTFVIAMTGVAMWFILSEKSKLNIALFAFAFLFTTLSPTDIFPRYLREHLVTPYVLKGVPCIFVWFKLMYDMLTLPAETKLPQPVN